MTDCMRSQNHSPSTPKSSARLAAEAAFTLPDDFGPQPELGPAPVVTTVSRKLVVLPPTELPIGGAESKLEPLLSQGPPIEESKHPRVFLIRPAVVQSAPADFLTPPPGRISETAGRPRRRHNASAPVKVIYKAPSAVPGAAAAAASAQASALLAGLDPSVARLAVELAALDSTFAVIQAAMAFEVADGRSSADWERLSKAADRISAEIEAFMAAPLR